MSRVLSLALVLAAPAGAQIAASPERPELASSPASASPAPNVICIVLDDLGYADIEPYDEDVFIMTPVMQALADNGAKLTGFATSGSMCSPTRASLLAGVEPAELGFMDVIDAETEWGLPADVDTVAEVFAAGGYVTGHVGKWHVGEDVGAFTGEFMPPAAGFVHSARLKRTEPISHFDPVIVIDEQTEVQETGHGTTVLTDHALAFIDEHAGGPDPFFLQLWYFAPHLPAEAPEFFIDLYTDDPDPDDWTVYGAMVSHVDASIGLILGRLQDLGIRQETLVMVTSDNGGTDAGGLHPGGNGELRDFKRSFYEGGIRVPFLASWPGEIAPGTVRDDLVLSLDLLATAIELTGQGGSFDPGDGRSMLPVLRGEDVPPRDGTLLWMGRAAADSFDPADGIVDAFAARRQDGVLGPEDWKLVYDVDGNLSLFDLATDLGETNDLVDVEPAVAETLWDAFWSARAPGTVVGWQGEPTGDVIDLGGAWAFDGGRVDIPSETRFDFHDGDFTARVAFTPAAGGPAATRVVMRKPGSWNLSIDPTDRLRLLVTDDAGQQQALSTPAPLALGAPHLASFTVHAWTGSPNTVTLFVDGVEIGTLPLDEVAANRNAIEIGNTAAGSEPFTGVIAEPDFHVIGLTVEETLGTWPAFPGAMAR